MAFQPLNSRERKQVRGVWLSDATWNLWEDTVRRAQELDRRAYRDAVLRMACYALRRQQQRDADRLGVDLTPPSTIMPERPKPAPDEPFRGPPSAPAY